MDQPLTSQSPWLDFKNKHTKQICQISWSGRSFHDGLCAIS